MKSDKRKTSQIYLESNNYFQKNVEKRRTSLYKEIDQLFKDHEGRDHLVLSFNDIICFPSAVSSAISNSNGTHAFGILSPQQG
jgi:hypothetical protein